MVNILANEIFSYMKDSTLLYENLSFNTHPALVTEEYDGWLIRYSNGYTKRANSVSAIGASTIDIDEKIKYCEEYYRSKDLPCVFKITDDEEYFAKRLFELGYQEVTPTDLLTMPLEGKTFNTSDCIITEGPTDEWFDAYFGISEYTKQIYIDTATEMINNIAHPAYYCLIKEGDRPVACASSVIENGYMCLLSVITDKEYRLRGYGRKVCENILDQTVKSGLAHTAYLQVVANNGPAYHIYETLGYKKLYTYRYLQR